MALFFECPEKCALNKLDEADIVRDGVMGHGGELAWGYLPCVGHSFAGASTNLARSTHRSTFKTLSIDSR
jgi:hypothetical protein